MMTDKLTTITAGKLAAEWETKWKPLVEAGIVIIGGEGYEVENISIGMVNAKHSNLTFAHPYSAYVEYEVTWLKDTSPSAGDEGAETSPRAEIRKRYEDYKARSDKDGLTSLSYVDWLETTHLTTVEWKDQRIIRLEQQLADAQRELTTLTARAEQAEARAKNEFNRYVEQVNSTIIGYSEEFGYALNNETIEYILTRNNSDVMWDENHPALKTTIEQGYAVVRSTSRCGEFPLVHNCYWLDLTDKGERRLKALLGEVRSNTAGKDLLEQLATVTRERDALRKLCSEAEFALRRSQNVTNDTKKWLDVIEALRKAAQEAT